MQIYCDAHQTFDCRCNDDLVPTLTLKQFRLTRRYCTDFAAHFGDRTTFEGQNEGWLYLDGLLWIADVPGKPYWVLLDRTEYESRNHSGLERKLYKYAVDAGLVRAPTPKPKAAQAAQAAQATPVAPKPERPLPKSLHTITVLEHLARWLMEAQGFTHDEAMRNALWILKLYSLRDPYGLAATAQLKITPRKEDRS